MCKKFFDFGQKLVIIEDMLKENGGL